MFNCPECNYGLTLVDNDLLVGFKCERCLISKLLDNKNKPDFSKEKLYSLLVEHCKNPDVSEKKYVLPEKDATTPIEDTTTPIEDTISTEDRKSQLQNIKINFSDEDKSIMRSLPSNTNPDRSESFQEVLKFVESSIKCGTKYIVVNAPTGIGKSHVAATLCKFLKGGVILTEQTSLQLQYVQEFPWMNQVKGMNNFLCPSLEWDKKANFGNCDGCNFRCNNDDFEIINEGTEKETVSVIASSRFAGLSTEILHNLKTLDIIREEYKTCTAAEVTAKVITPEEQKKYEELQRRCIIKYKNQYFFVLPEEKIPEESEVQTTSDGKLLIQKNEICPYYQQRIMGEKGSFAVYNYAMYVSTMLGKNTDSEKTKPRQILICDEAHYLEEVLKKQGTINLNLESIEESIGNKKLIDSIRNNTSEKKLMPLISNLEELLLIFEEKYRDIRKHRDCVIFLNSKTHIDKHRCDYCQKHKLTIKKCRDCLRLSKDVVGGMFLGCEPHFSSDSHINCKVNHVRFTVKYAKKIREERKNLKSGIAIIKKIREKWTDDKNNFVLQLEKNKITIQPIRVSETAKTLFLNFHHVVFLSSTIHEEIFMDDMGIVEDYAFKSFPNPIPIHDRIIKMWPSPLVKWGPPKEQYEQYRTISQKIISILNDHKNEKGLILVNGYPDLEKLLPFITKVFPNCEHCNSGNYSIAEDRLTYAKNRVDNKSPEIKNGELLTIHESKPHSVLFSPSMWQGYDLNGKSGEFCIIATAPIMPISEERNPYGHAKVRLRGNREWWNMRNAFKFVQGTGRCVRGPGDRATTYVLDDGCVDLRNWLEMYIKKDTNLKWFTDSMEDY